MAINKSKTISVIGGGTGTFMVLSGLKKYPELNLNAIVAVTDSGGSTGHLRDEYGTLPVGDIRQCIVALADSTNGHNILRELLMYRFDKGDVKGHNFGNLFLTALTEMLGSEEAAIQQAAKILHIRGNVIPISNEKIDLVANYEDGTELVGEHLIDEPDENHNCQQRISDLKVQPLAQISLKAKTAILESDYIILGPGDLYTSILPNVVVGGAKEALCNSKAKIIYIVNLMTKNGQTTDYTAQDHVNDIIKYSGRTPDYIFINNSQLPNNILTNYQEEYAFPVIDDVVEDANTKSIIIRSDFVSDELVKKQDSDILKRSLIRHDSTKVAETIMAIANLD